MTVKKSEKRLLEFFGGGLLTIHFILGLSKKELSPQLNIVMNENQIILGIFQFIMILIPLLY